MVDFPLVLSVASFAVLVLAATIGEFLRRRSPTSTEAKNDDSGVVLAGTLTLLGLIIGFSFSMATSRYDLRKNCEQAETNAIAVAYMRAALLPPADAAKVHELLKKYLDQRILFYSTRDRRQLDKIDADTTQIQSELWSSIQTALQPLPPSSRGFSSRIPTTLSSRSSPRKRCG